MAEPVPTEFTVRGVSQLKESPNGHRYLECKVDGGVIAFWGSPKNMANIEVVQRMDPPFVVICDCVPSNWDRHALWVPETGEVYALNPALPSEPDKTGERPIRPALVVHAELAEIRHQLLALLSRLESAHPQSQAEGPSLRIRALTEQGVIPREIAALMRVVTEMRNASEYESKELNEFESAAVRNAWHAIGEWAKNRGVDPF